MTIAYGFSFLDKSCSPLKILCELSFIYHRLKLRLKMAGICLIMDILIVKKVAERNYE